MSYLYMIFQQLIEEMQLVELWVRLKVYRSQEFLYTYILGHENLMNSGITSVCENLELTRIVSSVLYSQLQL